MLNARFNVFQGLQHNHVLLVNALDFLLSDAVVQSDLRRKQFLSLLLSWMLHHNFLFLVESESIWVALKLIIFGRFTVHSLLL